MSQTPAAAQPAPPREVHPLRNPRIAGPFALLLLVVHLPFLHALLRGEREVTQAVPFKDTFDRQVLGDDWWGNGGLYRIVDGWFYSPGVTNNPTWLKARLPADVRIEFDVRSEGPTGDIKWEAFGDGRNHATGYVFLFGAWNNRESRICKLDEHALAAEEEKARLTALARPYPTRSAGLEALIESLRQPFVSWGARRALERLAAGTYYQRDTPVVVRRTEPKVQKGRTYHMVVTKKGNLIRWELDGSLMLELNDPAPLSGPGHDRFGFSSWMNDTYFDNLSITPL